MAGDITQASAQVSLNETDSQSKYSDKAGDAMDWLKGKGSEALQSAESVFSTVSGKAALQKVAAYIQESDAVNTAMATRIYDLLDREDRLQDRVSKAEKTIRANSRLLLVSLVIHAVSIGLIIYLVLNRS